MNNGCILQPLCSIMIDESDMLALLMHFTHRQEVSIVLFDLKVYILFAADIYDCNN